MLLAGTFLRPTGGRAWNPVEILPPDEAPSEQHSAVARAILEGTRPNSRFGWPLGEVD